MTHELPNPFQRPDGSTVRTPAEWRTHRETLKDLLTTHMFGTVPPPPSSVTGTVTSTQILSEDAMIVDSVELSIPEQPTLTMKLRVVRPAIDGPVPVIVWNQFTGYDHCPIEETLVVQHGYAIAEFEREQWAADSPEALNGPLAQAYPGYTWGAIAMWAWMQNRVVDYLLTTPYADPGRLVSTGHSRGGKVALCAGAYDERYAVVHANGSGCGGAGCYRFLGGRLGQGHGDVETIDIITTAFPYWFTPSFATYARNVDALPFDLHTLKALIAPRVLLTTDAMEDTWANPYGTLVTWRASAEVYAFLGAPDRTLMHTREGGHRYDAQDWLALLETLELCFRQRSLGQTELIAPIHGDWPHTRLHHSWTAPTT